MVFWFWFYERFIYHTFELGAQPYAVHAPRKIHVPLLPKVKEKLDRLLCLGVISSVDEPTE